MEYKYASSEDSLTTTVNTSFIELDVNKRLQSIVDEKWNNIRQQYVDINAEERVVNETIKTNNEFLKLKDSTKQDMIIISENYGPASAHIEYVIFMVFNYKISLDITNIKLENCVAKNLFPVSGMDSVYALVVNVGKKQKYKNDETQRLELEEAKRELQIVLNDVNSTITQTSEARQKVADIEGIPYYDFVKNNFELQMVDLKVSLNLDAHKDKVWTQRYVATFPVITLYGNHVIYMELSTTKMSITESSVNEFTELLGLKDIYNYTCESNYFGNLTKDVKIEGVDKIDVTKEGIYTVTYRVTDEIGNMSRVERTIIVRNTADPEYVDLTQDLFGSYEDITKNVRGGMCESHLTPAEPRLRPSKQVRIPILTNAKYWPKDAKETGCSRWSNGVVPFIIRLAKDDSVNGFTGTQETHILSAVNLFNKTLRDIDNDDKDARYIIKYSPRSTVNPEEDYVEFVKSSANLSFTGRMGGLQKLQLTSKVSDGDIATIAHEMLHCAGLGHDNQRSDRDQYITMTNKFSLDRRTVGSGLSEETAEHQYDALENTVNIGSYNTQSLMHYNNREKIYFSPQVSNLNLNTGEYNGVQWRVGSYDVFGDYNEIIAPPYHNTSGDMVVQTKKWFEINEKWVTLPIEEKLLNSDETLTDFAKKYMVEPSNMTGPFDDGVILALEYMYLGFHSSISGCRLANLSSNPKTITYNDPETSKDKTINVTNSGKTPMPMLDISSKYSPQILANYPQEFSLYLCSNKPCYANVVVLNQSQYNSFINPSDGKHTLTETEILNGFKNSVYNKKIPINNRKYGQLNFETTFNIGEFETALPANWEYHETGFTNKVNLLTDGSGSFTTGVETALNTLVFKEAKDTSGNVLTTNFDELKGTVVSKTHTRVVTTDMTKDDLNSHNEIVTGITDKNGIDVTTVVYSLRENLEVVDMNGTLMLQHLSKYKPVQYTYYINILLQDAYHQTSKDTEKTWTNWLSGTGTVSNGIYYMTHTTPPATNYQILEKFLENDFYKDTISIHRNLHLVPTNSSHPTIIDSSGNDKNKIQLKLKSDYYNNDIQFIIYNIQDRMIKKNPFENPILKGRLGDLPRYITHTDMDKIYNITFSGFEDDNTYCIYLRDINNDGMIYNLDSIVGYNNTESNYWGSVDTISNPAKFSISQQALKQSTTEVKTNQTTPTESYSLTYERPGDFSVEFVSTSDDTHVYPNGSVSGKTDAHIKYDGYLGKTYYYGIRQNGDLGVGGRVGSVVDTTIYQHFGNKSKYRLGDGLYEIYPGGTGYPNGPIVKNSSGVNEQQPPRVNKIETTNNSILIDIETNQLCRVNVLIWEKGNDNVARDNIYKLFNTSNSIDDGIYKGLFRTREQIKTDKFYIIQETLTRTKNNENEPNYGSNIIKIQELIKGSHTSNDVNITSEGLKANTEYNMTIITEALYKETNDGHIKEAYIEPTMPTYDNTNNTQIIKSNDLQMDSNKTIIVGNYLGLSDTLLEHPHSSANFCVLKVQTNDISEIADAGMNTEHSKIVVIKLQDITNYLSRNNKTDGLNPEKLTISLYDINNPSVPVYHFDSNPFKERYISLLTHEVGYPFIVVKVVGLSESIIYGISLSDGTSYTDSKINLGKHAHVFQHSTYSHTH